MIYPSQMKYCHTTQNEIDFLEEIASRPHGRRLIQGYLRAMPKRQNWDILNPNMIKVHAEGLLSLLMVPL